MDTDRPQLYFFLLPFTLVSLLIYALIIIEIYRKKGLSMYDCLFFRLLCSQSIYDISFVIMYFVMELPQDWPALHSYFLAMNDTILPQLIYAHMFLSLIAQILGVTMMSVSRMMMVCHPVHSLTKILKHISLKQVVLCHCIIPITYACHIVLHQAWRYYGFNGQSTRIALLGNHDSIMVVPFGVGAAKSLTTSFVLVCALFICTAYFGTSLYFLTTNRTLYFALRSHFYAFTFFLSLANPWCLMITSASIRASVLRRCLPSACTRPVSPTSEVVPRPATEFSSSIVPTI